MIPIQPTNEDFKITKINTGNRVLRWAQSVFKSLNAGLTFASPTAQAAGGVYNKFVQDNFDGVMLYIGANASGATITWAATNVGQAINHGLHRQPIGFLVTYKDKTVDVYSTATPDVNNITLATTDDTVNTIVFIF
jgi:hypothetical protein